MIRPPVPGDEPALLALNNAHARELSELTAEGLRALLAGAFHARVAEGATALLVAFDQDAAYRSPNFLWFRARHRRFVYIDRVVVAPSARGRGLARALYGDVIRRASASGHALLCCEVNSDPPNPGSDAFHAALGFAEAGRACLPERGKSVRYLMRPI